MKLLFAVLLVAVAAETSPAGPTDQAILAAMKLSEQPNYSWTSTVMDDAATYDIDGKTDRAGWTWLRLPMVKSIAQRLGREADVQIEALFKGTDSYVIRTESGWKTLDELPKRSRDWNDVDTVWVVPPGSAGGWGSSRGTRGMPGGGIFDPNDPFAGDPFPVIIHAAPSHRDDDERPYSNAQFGISRPQDELAVIVSSYADLKVRNDVVFGSLSTLGAQLLLVREGQSNIQPAAAAGVFRLSIQNGMVTKYSVQLEGVLFVDRKQVHVRQTSTTVIREIGATAFQIPDEARRKLGG